MSLLLNITSPKAKKGRWKFDLDLPNDIHVQVCSNRSSSLRVCMAFMTIIEQLQQRNPGERGCVFKKRQFFTILFKILNLIQSVFIYGACTEDT